MGKLTKNTLVEKIKATAGNIASGAKEVVENIGQKMLRGLPTGVILAAALLFSHIQPAAAQTVPSQTANEPTTKPAIERDIASYKFKPGICYSVANNQLFRLQNFSKTDKEVRQEVSVLFAQMNVNTFDLSEDYKTLEEQTITKTSLTAEQVTAIAEKLGNGYTDEQNFTVAKLSMQHFIHVILDTLFLIRTGADKVEFNKADEDGLNEFVKFYINADERNIQKESAAVLQLLEKYILDYAKFDYQINQPQDCKKLYEDLKSNIDKLKSLTSLTSAVDYNEISNLVIKIATQLSPSIFGESEMRKKLINEYSEQLLLNSLLGKLKVLGYDMSNLSALQSYNESAQTSFEGIHLGTNISPTEGRFTFGATGKTEFQNGFGVEFGGEASVANSPEGKSFQLKGIVEPSFTFSEIDHTVSFPIKSGIDVADGSKVTVPLDVGLAYKIPLSENGNIWIEVGFGVFTNLMKRPDQVDLGGSISIIAKAPNGMNVKFTAAAGGTVGEQFKVLGSPDKDNGKIEEGDTEDGGLSPKF